MWLLFLLPLFVKEGPVKAYDSGLAKQNLEQSDLTPKQDLDERDLAPKEQQQDLASKHGLGQHDLDARPDRGQHDLAPKQDLGQHELAPKQGLSRQHLAQDDKSQQPYLQYNPNATSCETFLNNTVFDPETVLDADWKIFYFWSPEAEASYNIRFSRPSKMLVDRFRQELDKEIKPPVNWTAAELFMESSIDFSALYIKTNVSGKYRLIPTAAFDYPALPMLIFGLKVVKQGYMGIENCKHRFCYALAPVEKMPLHYELDEAAATLGFFNNNNRSYMYVKPGPSSNVPYTFHDEDMDIDDDDLDQELDPSKLQMF